MQKLIIHITHINKTITINYLHNEKNDYIQKKSSLLYSKRFQGRARTNSRPLNTPMIYY